MSKLMERPAEKPMGYWPLTDWDACRFANSLSRRRLLGRLDFTVRADVEEWCRVLNLDADNVKGPAQVAGTHELEDGRVVYVVKRAKVE